MADAYEAVVGALFLDRGMEARRARPDPGRAHARRRLPAPEPDPKTLLRIRLQAVGRGLPVYQSVGESGPDHAKRFVVEVLAGGEPLGRGQGGTKREAQAAAAAAALLILSAKSEA